MEVYFINQRNPVRPPPSQFNRIISFSTLALSCINSQWQTEISSSKSLGGQYITLYFNRLTIVNSELEHLKSVYNKKISGRNKVKVPVVDSLSNSDPSCDHIILLKCFEKQQIQ